ncbi:MAG TPA: ABC transporter permease [Candidatus Dormibacteraeota bacterium]|nr:ABC transporter permease [Candidatus Dormibacteraeota bacterium]
MTAEAQSISAPRVASRNLRRLLRQSGGWEGAIGLAVVAALVLIAVLGPLLAPHDPNAIVSSRVIGPPDASHPFGSDSLGRDVLSRVLSALRVSLAVAVGSVVLALLIGIPVGLAAGYFGGWVDNLLMRPLDLLLAFPALLLAIAFIAIVGPGTFVALLAIAIIYTPILARVVRGSVLVVRERPFVVGARARGASSVRIMLGHVLPNSLGPAIAQASVLTAFAIQLQAALSFLGLGAQPPTSELGLMLYEGRDVLTQAPWVEIYPGVALAVSVLGFILLGDGLQERLQPRRRRQ